MDNITELELWKPVAIEGFDHYLVSQKGRVINSRTGHFLTPCLNRDKYHCMTLSNEGKSSVLTLHRLVGLSWIPNPENKRTINHKDGDKLNNHVDNLEWMSTLDNIQHAFDTGINVYHRDKLEKDKNVIEGMLIEGLTYTEISKKYDCSYATIKRFVIDNELKKPRYTTRMTLTKKEVGEAYELYNRGLSFRAIGKEFKTSHVTIRSCLNKFYGSEHIDKIKKEVNRRS